MRAALRQARLHRMGFNTDDGSGRAALCKESKQWKKEHKRFNTDDGSGRAAMVPSYSSKDSPFIVSIPITVVGGLQFM